MATHPTVFMGSVWLPRCRLAADGPSPQVKAAELAVEGSSRPLPEPSTILSSLPSNQVSSRRFHDRSPIHRIPGAVLRIPGFLRIPEFSARFPGYPRMFSCRGYSRSAVRRFGGAARRRYGGSAVRQPRWRLRVSMRKMGAAAAVLAAARWWCDRSGGVGVSVVPSPR